MKNDKINPYIPIETEIKDIIDETPNIKTFVLKPKESFSFETGQFVELTVPGIGEAPFTPSSSPFEKETLEITIMDVGVVTNKLHKMNKGDIVGLRGPYGKGYPIEDFHNREVLIVGGGVGLAPLRSFLLTLLAQKEKFKKIVLCYGARTPDDIVYKKLFPHWHKYKSMDILRSVDKADNSWKETEGVVTVLLDKIKVSIPSSVGVVCGPPIMMKFSTKKLLDMGLKPSQIFLSMEKNMSCGLGQCGHCLMGHYFVCKDGPVFRYEEIKNIPNIWD